MEQRGRGLAQAKAREVPSFMTHQMALVWERRWTRMLCTVCRVFCGVVGGAVARRRVGHAILSEVLTHDPRKFWTVTDHISLWFEKKEFSYGPYSSKVVTSRFARCSGIAAETFTDPCD